MIPSFRQYLNEKLYRGVSLPNGYAEVYLNPTRQEMMEITYEDPRVQAGGILSGDKLYVWNRDYGMHSEIKYTLPRPLDVEWLPLYLYYNWKTRNVTVELSEFSMQAERRRGYNTPEKIREITNRLKDAKALKSLGTVTVRPW